MMSRRSVACQTDLAGDTEPAVRVGAATADAATQTSPLKAAADAGEAPGRGPPFRDERWYVVWAVPRAPGLVGIHRAAGIGGWKALEAQLPGSHYAGSGARLRRAESEAAALELYASESRKHGTPEEHARHEHSGR